MVALLTAVSQNCIKSDPIVTRSAAGWCKCQPHPPLSAQLSGKCTLLKLSIELCSSVVQLLVCYGFPTIAIKSDIFSLRLTVAINVGVQRHRSGLSRIFPGQYHGNMVCSWA